MDWQLQYAKNQFLKLVQSARTQGPQIVTVRGERAAVVLSANDYDALRANRPTLVDHLLSGPTWDQELSTPFRNGKKPPVGTSPSDVSRRHQRRLRSAARRARSGPLAALGRSPRRPSQRHHPRRNHARHRHKAKSRSPRRRASGGMAAKTPPRTRRPILAVTDQIALEWADRRTAAARRGRRPDRRDRDRPRSDHRHPQCRRFRRHPRFSDQSMGLG